MSFIVERIELAQSWASKEPTDRVTGQPFSCCLLIHGHHLNRMKDWTLRLLGVKKATKSNSVPSIFDLNDNLLIAKEDGERWKCTEPQYDNDGRVMGIPLQIKKSPYNQTPKCTAYVIQLAIANSEYETGAFSAGKSNNIKSESLEQIRQFLVERTTRAKRLRESTGVTEEPPLKRLKYSTLNCEIDYDLIPTDEARYFIRIVPLNVTIELEAKEGVITIAKDPSKLVDCLKGYQINNSYFSSRAAITLTWDFDKSLDVLAKIENRGGYAFFRNKRRITHGQEKPLLVGDQLLYGNNLIIEYISEVK